MSISTPTLITFVIYIGAMLLIGFIAYRATKNFDDYILGGRSLGSFVTALSAGASDMSGWLLMGLPGAIFVAGLSESWIAIGLIAGAWLNWLFVAGRLRVHTERNKNALTLPDYFSHRFEDESRMLRIFSALVVLVFFTIYCASGVVAGARLFESSFGVPYDVALWIGAAATILYVFIGGFLAVSWTDPGLGRHGRCDGHHRDPEPGRLRYVQRAVLRCHHLVAGLGPWLLRTAAHPGALHGRRLGEDHP